MINKITIIGVGLIGGSLAKAIKERNLAKVVFGYGRDLSRLKKAKKSNIIDELSTSMKQAVDNGCSHAVLEVSSEALAKRTTSGLDWDVAVLTNLRRDDTRRNSR